MPIQRCAPLICWPMPGMKTRIKRKKCSKRQKRTAEAEEVLVPDKPNDDSAAKAEGRVEELFEKGMMGAAGKCPIEHFGRRRIKHHRKPHRKDHENTDQQSKTLFTHHLIRSLSPGLRRFAWASFMLLSLRRSSTFMWFFTAIVQGLSPFFTT